MGSPYKGLGAITGTPNSAPVRPGAVRAKLPAGPRMMAARPGPRPSPKPAALAPAPAPAPEPAKKSKKKKKKKGLWGKVKGAAKKAQNTVKSVAKAASKGTPVEKWVDQASKMSAKKMLHDPTNLLVPGGLEFAKVNFKTGLALSGKVSGMAGGQMDAGDLADVGLEYGKQQAADYAGQYADEYAAQYGVDPDDIGGLLG